MASCICFFIASHAKPENWGSNETAHMAKPRPKGREPSRSFDGAFQEIGIFASGNQTSFEQKSRFRWYPLVI